MNSGSLFIDLLMCALKRAPVVGVAADVIDLICKRAELSGYDNRISSLEWQMSDIDRKIHDTVATEVRRICDTLGAPNLPGAALTEEMRTLLSIRAGGWDPILSEGIFRNSSHWKELHRCPQNYGRVLKGNETCAPDAVQLLIDVDGPKILELSPFAFSSLLCNQSAGIPPAQVFGSEDVWAVRDNGQFSGIRTSDLATGPGLDPFAGQSHPSVRVATDLHHTCLRCKEPSLGNGALCRRCQESARESMVLGTGSLEGWGSDHFAALSRDSRHVCPRCSEASSSDDVFCEKCNVFIHHECLESRFTDYTVGETVNHPIYILLRELHCPKCNDVLLRDRFSDGKWVRCVPRND
jgi:hypothetical protein